jgi:hypothetical protein
MKLFSTIFISIAISQMAYPNTVITNNGGAMLRLRHYIEDYYKLNNGRLPEKLEDIIMDMREEDRESFLIRKSVLYFNSNQASWRETGMIADGALIAISATPISEDRRAGIGRYILVRDSIGRFESSWGDEEKIQNAFALAGIRLPTAATYKEKPLLPASDEYAAILLTDALAHGVPRAEAVIIIDRHINDALAGRVGTAKTWGEIANASSPQATTDNRTPPVAVAPSPLKWPALAAAVLAALALGWRFLRRK